MVGLADMRNHIREQRNVQCNGTAHAVRQRQLADHPVGPGADFRQDLEEAESKTNDIGTLGAVGGFRVAGCA